MWWELSPLTLSRLTDCDCTIRDPKIENLDADEDDEAFEDEVAGEWVGCTHRSE